MSTIPMIASSTMSFSTLGSVPPRLPVDTSGSPSDRVSRRWHNAHSRHSRVEYDEVVAVDDLPREGRAVFVGQLASLPSEEPRKLPCVEVDQPTRHGLTILIDEVDRIPGRKCAVRASDAGWEQGEAPPYYRLHCACIQMQATTWRAGVREPEEPCWSTAAGRVEVSADLCAVHHRSRIGGGGEHRRDARGGSNPRCVDLGRHPAGAYAGRSGLAQVDAGEFNRIHNLADERRTRSTRIDVVQPIDVRQEDEQVRVDEMRDQRRETVVVTESDLVGRYGVVLVDDGEHTEAEQAVKRALCVSVVRSAGHVGGGKQNLRHRHVVAGKYVGVTRHQQALSDARGCLRGCEVTGTPGQAQRGKARSDRAGGDKDELCTGCLTRRQHIGELRESRQVKSAPATGQRRRADLDDKTSSLPDLRSPVTHVILPH